MLPYIKRGFIISKSFYVTSWNYLHKTFSMLGWVKRGMNPLNIQIKHINITYNYKKIIKKDSRYIIDNDNK